MVKHHAEKVEEKKEKKAPSHRASGGKAVGNDMTHEPRGKINAYTAKDSPEEHSAEEEKDSFAKGGRAKKRKEVDSAEGKKPAHRLDKRASGGRMSGGHSPLTTASDVKGRPGGEYGGAKGIDREDD